MPESFAWPEGAIAVYTGNATPSTSALIAYAKDTNVSIAYGWDNRANASGVYLNHLTGTRADVTFNAVYTVDTTIAKMTQSATAIHVKVIQNNVIGSAGYFFYSGRIVNLRLVGNERDTYKYQFTYFANSWSAF